MPEDMQDYLARMNKQLEAMAAQHLQVSSGVLLVDALLRKSRSAVDTKRCAQHTGCIVYRCISRVCLVYASALLQQRKAWQSSMCAPAQS
jgi:hypothetical protein